MAPELKLGQDLRLRQQLVMTPQLQQAIKILQLSRLELETVVQSELDANPMLEMLEPIPPENTTTTESDPQSASESEPAADASNNGDGPDGEWEPGVDERPPETLATEAPDAAVEMRELDRLDKLD